MYYYYYYYYYYYMFMNFQCYVYSVYYAPLCSSMYRLCVNVYCNTATGCQPNYI
jgi:hypothetical protein